MDRRQRIAQIALAHAGCSVAVKRDVYAEVIVRPADPPSATPYYFDNPQLSTCALFGLGCIRLAGCVEPEVASAYYPRRVGKAVSDLVGLASRFGAWVTGSAPVPPMKAGDVWIITNDAGESHVGVCVEDVQVSKDTWCGRCAEGGQFDGKGSTAIGLFTRTWRMVGNRWMVGSRYLLGYASADRLPVPDTIDDAPADPAA